MSRRDSLSQVRCFLLHTDGTIYLGERLLDGAAEFLEACANRAAKDDQQILEFFNTFRQWLNILKTLIQT